MSKLKLTVKKYKSQGDLAHEYNPLHNKMSESGKLEDFITDEINFDLNKPVDIECQPSYDGTVNLIINDDMNPPRIVNTTYSVIEDNRYRRILRNQTEQTNIYKEGKIDSQTRLFRNIQKLPKIELNNISYHGQLKGGNYTIYIKLADNDYNKTDIAAESSIISIFKGTIEKIYSISGTLEDERTDKAIQIQINNLDTSFSRLFVYVRREYSDLNGVLKQETYQIRESYKIISSSLLITLDGYEETLPIDQEELNISYNICTGVKTQAQVQNMLFFGNIQQTVIDNHNLQNISYFIEAEYDNKSVEIGYIDPAYYARSTQDSTYALSNVGKIEYYNPLQLYYFLGYWPEELYRFGIVYIFKDDSLSSVYNLRGCKFTTSNTKNFTYSKDNDGTDNYTSLYDNNGNINSINKEEFFLAGGSLLLNTKGVFRFPDIDVYNHSTKETHPIGIRFTINEELIKTLKDDYGVKGFFFVRQKRIPNILAQGYSIGVDKSSYIPMLFDDNLTDESNPKGKYFTESFINNKLNLSTTYRDRIISTSSKQSSGLLCVDAMVSPQLKSIFDNSEFTLSADYKFKLGNHPSIDRLYYSKYPEEEEVISVENCQSKLLYIDTDIPLKYVDEYGFSTRAGSAEDVKEIRFFNDKNYYQDNFNIVRGVYCPFIGTNQNMDNNTIYTIRTNNYSSTYETQYFKIRGNDLSPFMAISPRYELNDTDLENNYYLYKHTIKREFDGEEWVEVSSDKELIFEGTLSEIENLPLTPVESDAETITYDSEKAGYRVPAVFRGDCFTATVTVKINSNFIDSNLPTNEVIVAPNTWKDGYKGYSEMGVSEWGDINRADINTVPMGHWITYKCLSNFNLCLRSENRQHVEEMSTMGNARSFYPLQGITTAPPSKIPESQLLNAGYSSTLPFKKYFSASNVPYIRDIFDSRIMFSAVQVDDDFINAYRIFQGLSYKDIERQYGAIVKLIALGANLFCVFEHGCAIIPINEKALMATTTGQSIHMYGAGVLQNQVTPVSPDYGSIWQESVIRTPNGIYGVDTSAKKIWRYNIKGFMIISDMVVQRFLNDNIILQESDKYPTIALKNVKTHYNNYKGDVMFTFYNGDKVWNLCYNERLEKWITKYSWTPLASENINNIFLSLDRQRAALYGIIYDNINTESGAHIEDRFTDGEKEILNIELQNENISEDRQLYILDRIKYINDNFTNTTRTCGNLWEPANITRVITMKGYEFFEKFNVRISSITSSTLNETGVEHIINFCEVPNSAYDVKCEVFNLEDKSFSEYIIIDDNNNDLGSISIKQEDNHLLLSIDDCPDLSKLLYLKINFEVTPSVSAISKEYDNDENISEQTGKNKIEALSNTLEETIILIRDVTVLEDDKKKEYENLLRNGFYVHGRAGIFDEINYFDEISDNEILPTRWYNKEEPFEFEFVVNTPSGIHKIFDNLVLISNNVEPQSLEFEFIGDVYDFNKSGIYKSEHVSADSYWNSDGSFNEEGYRKKQLEEEFPNSSTISNNFYKGQVTVDKDIVTGQYYLKVNQPLENIKTKGRRLGNIEYKEDRWFTTITPIYYCNKQMKDNKIYQSAIKSTRIRDKWVKIRIKYKGDKLVVINAIHSLLRVSYA